MTKAEEVNSVFNSLDELVSNSDFLSDFQRANYKVLVINYHSPAEILADDYDSFKAHYDKLPANSPKRPQYKVRLEETETEINSFLTSLNLVKQEINDMSTLLTKINEINNKLDNLKTPTTTAPDLSNLATKTDINEVKTTIGNIKITPTDLTPLSDKVDGVDKKIDNIKLPTVDLSSLDTKLDTIKTNTEKPQITPCPCDIKSLESKIEDLKKQLTTTSQPVKEPTKPDTSTSQPSQQESKPILTQDQKEAKTAEQLVKGNQNINEYQARMGTKYPIFLTDGNLFVKGIREENTKNRLLLRQDPTTKLWGIVYFNQIDNTRVYYYSPNATYLNEKGSVETWLNAESVIGGNTGRKLENWPNFSNKYKNTDQRFSLLWGMGFLAIVGEAWKQGGTFEWDYFSDDNRWRPLAEAELKKYDNQSL